MHLQMHSLNWVAVLVAAISTMVVGFSGTAAASQKHGRARWATI